MPILSPLRARAASKERGSGGMSDAASGGGVSYLAALRTIERLIPRLIALGYRFGNDWIQPPRQGKLDPEGWRKSHGSL